MTVALQFTPLYGAETGNAVCCLLRIGPATILLDCGWDERFDPQLLEPLMQLLPQVDLVLLSQPDLCHLGALPYLVGKAGLTAPVYASTPVARLGPIFYHDCYTSIHSSSEFSVFAPEDVDAAFEHVKPLKHHQLQELHLRGLNLSVTGLPAGHSIGGTVWVLESGGEVVVYGPHTNHMKERHLRGGELNSVPMRPVLLVAGPGAAAAGGGHGGRGGLPRAPLSRAARDAALLEALREVFARGGNVLLPVDSSGRLLELLLVLDQLWSSHKLVYHLALLSHVADSAVRAAAGLIEWMSDEVQREFNLTSQNPLACRHVKRCHNLGDVSRLGEGSKVVLVSGLSLGCGLSRQLLVAWGADARNALIFTQQPPPGSLAHELLSLSTAARPLNLSLLMGHREPLTGVELQLYEAARAEAEAAAAEEAAAAAAAGAAADAAELLPLRESSGAIRQLKRNATGALEQVLGDNAYEGWEEICCVEEGVLMDGFAPPPPATYCMFPDESELLTQEWDAFGAVLDSSALRQQQAELDLGAALPDDEDGDLEEQGPTKVVTETVQLAFQASVSLLEGFAGLSDAGSLATIVGLIAPRSLLLLGGDAAGRDLLEQQCRAKLSKQQTSIIQPGSGQEVRVRLASSYRVTLQQQLLDSLSRHHLGPYEVGWLDGMLAAPAAPADDDAADADVAAAAAAAAGGGDGEQQHGQSAGGAHGTGASGPEQQRKRKVHWLDREELLTVTLPPAATATAVAAGDGLGEVGSMSVDILGSLVSDAPSAAAGRVGANGVPEGEQGQQLDAAAAAEAGDHGGIFIGDVKLSEVKQALASVGIPSQFKDRQLLVKNTLLVSRQGLDGQLMLEGPLSEDYFRVRDVVYGLYNVC